MSVQLDLETDRLLLRQWRESDFDAYAEFRAHEDTAKYVGGVLSRSHAWRRFLATIGHWTLRGYGFWAVDEKVTSRFVGGVGLGLHEGYPEPCLGYWILPESRRKGYAVEAGREAIKFAFSNLGFSTLVSFVDPDNGPSILVTERLGGRFEKTIELADRGQHLVYRYTDTKSPTHANGPLSTPNCGMIHTGEH